MPRAAIAVMLSLSLSLSLSAQLTEADLQWERRGDSAQGGHARPERIDAAIAGYRRAIAEQPNSLEPRWKLMRALRFKGAYVAMTPEDKKAIYSDAKKVGDDALSLLGRLLAPKGLSSLSKASEKQVADAARTIPGTAELFMWDAANWGEWALAYGKLAAAREGAADRIRRSATIALLIDPRVEGGGPARVLGRLHDQTPRIPFITGWASSSEAVRFLRDAVKIDASSKISRVFLAEAMVNHSSGAKQQAVQILREVVNSPNNAAFTVEESAAQADARALLKKWGLS
jgi:hypothetical protein